MVRGRGMDTWHEEWRLEHGHMAQMGPMGHMERSGMEPMVLRGVSFEIKPGEHVGVVGRTGAQHDYFIFNIVSRPNPALCRSREELSPHGTLPLGGTDIRVNSC